MPSRREVLGWLAGGAAAALPGVVPSQKPSRGPKPKPTPTPIIKQQGGRVTTRPRLYSIRATDTATARFPGDPGVGKVMTGGTQDTLGTPNVSDGVTDLNSITGVNHVLCRRFETDLWNRSDIISDQNAGRLPFPSFKCRRSPGGTTESPISAVNGINNGERDAALASEAVWAAGQGYVIFTTYFHEPASDFPTESDAAAFRLANRRVVDIFRDNNATNVVWNNPITEGVWTFHAAGGEAGGDLKWYHWDPDWKGTQSGSGRPNASDWYTGSESMVDIQAHDMYNPLVNGTTWRNFATDYATIKNRMIADGREVKPWTVPEFGTGLIGSYTSGVPGGGQPDEADWTLWYQQAFQTMRDEDGIGFVTYHTGVNRNLTSGGDDPLVRRAGYINALDSESDYIVTVRPS